MEEQPIKNAVHIVEIPVTGDGACPDGGNAEVAAFLDKAAEAESSGSHPLGEIAGSAGHLLLLKLWQREESRLGRRACALEALMDAARRDAFYLCAAFLAFHGLSLALLFAASVSASAVSPPAEQRAACCSRWWVPSSLSLVASLALSAAVQLRVCAGSAHGDTRAGAVRAGAPDEGCGVRPVQGAAVRGDEGQVRQRRGRRCVGPAPVVLPEHRRRLPARRRRRHHVLRQVHLVLVGRRLSAASLLC